jgi:transcriptional regulator with XRE-family HTH domain
LTVHRQNHGSTRFGAYSYGGMGRSPKKRRNPYGAWLHFLRKERGLTQDEVSRLTGLPRTTLMYWERTGNLIGRKQIMKLAKAYGVSIGELLRTEKSRYPIIRRGRG